MAEDGFARPTALGLMLLVPTAVLIVLAVTTIQVVAVLAQHDFEGVGFAIDGSEAAWELLFVYAVLVAVLLIAGVRQSRVALELLVPVALFVMVVVAWSDHNVVANRSELAAVGFGYPYDWLIQDHSWMSPPLPYLLSTYDIRESPVTVAWGAFASDLLLTYALLLSALLLARLAVSRSSRTDG